MFCIKSFNKEYYFSHVGAIILFDDPNMAVNFAESFFQYAFARASQDRKPDVIFDVMETRANTQVIEVDFYLDKVKTIHISELNNK